MESAESDEPVATPVTSIQEPDIMNDPKFNTNVKRKERDGEDVDTCRICRGEGSQEEPLFYPCKCSGSIKFVHQSCLLEWLAHSQKKHCELCKTPFRFTKLYHPHMPSAVPTPVFLRQAAVHGWATFQTWVRLQLVFFVWVFWLPWCMRTIWRGLFWVGDGAWVDWSEQGMQKRRDNLSDYTALSGNGSASNDAYFFGSRQAATNAFINYFGSKATQMMNSNPWRKEPVSLSLAKRLYRLLFQDSTATKMPIEGVKNATSIGHVVPRSSTWLSDLRFLRTMTRSTTINNIIIDTLEGQLITLFIVVAFILIFLIREWVMQQQQNMLLGPGGDNAELADPNNDAPAQQVPVQAAPERVQGEAGLPDNAARPRIFVRPRRRLNRPPAPGVGQQREEPLDAPVAGEPGSPSGEQSAMLDAESIGSTVMQSPEQSPTSQPLLPPKRTSDGRVVNPPVELEDLLRESTVFRDIIQRAQHDPTLNIMTIIRSEIPTYEVDNLLERLGAPEVQPYFKALHAPPLMIPAGVNPDAGDDDRLPVQGIIEEESSTGNGTSSDPLDGSMVGPEQVLASPDASANPYNRPDHVTTPDVHMKDRQVQDTAPHKDEDLDHAARTAWASIANAASAPQNDRSDMAPTWTFDDLDDGDISDIQYTPQESIDEPRRDKKAQDGNNLLDESQMADRLGSENLASRDVEIDHANRPPSRIETEEESQHVTNHQVEEAAQDQGYIEAIKNWLWGDIIPLTEVAGPQTGDDEHIVNDLADEAPFVPVGHGHDLLHRAEEAEGAGQDPEVLAAAAQAGIDPNEAEVVEEIEDLEGIMELIGMEGPLAGLMQNGMFCAVLVSLTIFFGVWIPYMCGKVFLTVVARPVMLFIASLRLASTSADTVVDILVVLAGGALYWTDVSINLLCRPVVWVLPSIRPYLENKTVAQASASYAQHAFDRLVKVSLAAGESFNDGIDIPTFSIIAHESLRQIEAQLSAVARTILGFQTSLMEAVFHCPNTTEALRLFTISIIAGVKMLIGHVVQNALALVDAAPSLLDVNPLKFTVASAQRSDPLDFGLASWDATDRAIATIAGYTFFALLGVLYLYIAGALRGTNKSGAVNGSLAQILYQAGGVMKVILIISIEMIIFPLYCGLLLDVALLPLFGNVTLRSRVEFTTTSPWTSVFIHWFVGTCYMFHFALFVSMCRRILRTGVLYFIRDPDDPTFHPVRDVLERSVSNQLWKISFSALVYGGLVLVCLGGVVWGIALALPAVFPIHWSSDEPVLEFPVDLLFYNFLMPMAVKFFKPSIGLSKIYGWWFRKCARTLRLSSFLFKDKRFDEEGRHLRRTWTDVFRGERGDILNPVIDEDRAVLAEDRNVRAIFIRDGKYVRTPGSDQVRIPKGATTFIEVDEKNNRLDGAKDEDEDPHGRKMNLFMQVYTPPFFRMRIAAFIGLIWLFAAFTGVSVTIVPLLFGRWVFAKLTPNHLRMNDIYAFSIGIYILGSAGWTLLNHRRIGEKLHALLPSQAADLVSMMRKMKPVAVQSLSLFYVYFALGILLPCLFSLVLEFYLIVPLHTYLQGIDNGMLQEDKTSEILTTMPFPVIHIIQDWTLGVLYVKMFARFILWTAPSRPALALRAIVARGWLTPDVRLATRAFILPATVVMALVLVMPLTLGSAVNNTILRSYTGDDAYARACVYRYSYPAVLALGLTIAVFWLAGKAFEGWRRKIRDEVYLIGERLHNFGEGARTGAMSRVRAGKLAVGRAQA